MKKKITITQVSTYNSESIIEVKVNNRVVDEISAYKHDNKLIMIHDYTSEYLRRTYHRTIMSALQSHIESVITLQDKESVAIA